MNPKNEVIGPPWISIRKEKFYIRNRHSSSSHLSYFGAITFIFLTLISIGSATVFSKSQKCQEQCLERNIVSFPIFG